jgi:mono/diheme cytochrome c family protein
MKLSRLVAPGLCALLLVALSFLAPAQDKKGSDGDVAKGKEVFEQCGVCHNADSDEKKMGPGLKGLFKKATFSDGKTKVTEEAVRKKIDEGGNGMPAYAEMLDSQEKRSLMAYLKTL